jgi:glycerophosphoryl diester phosphodiesterase
VLKLKRGVFLAWFAWVFIIAATTQADAATDKAVARRCKVVAHRGGSALAPENTLASIANAIRLGADCCEIDVYASADGHLVVMHDKRVERTTDGHGDLTKMTLAEIKRLDAGSRKDKRFAGERVPTLDEALAKLKDSGCKAIIEIKMPGISEKVVDAVRRANMVDQAMVLSFDENVIREVRTLEPRLEYGLNVAMPKEIAEKPLAERADWVAAKARQSSGCFVSLKYNSLSAELMAELHRRNVVVWAWIVDEPDAMKSLIDWGVAAIVTDRPDVACRLLEKQR